ncbi:Alpha/beta hydrolase fold-1 [Crassisporium funariophilum]|nr:Alpha/beta hydrolase fold-1 [Crassisporium funariophilum]
MASSKNIHGLTLLFTHCIGSHKEQWEPVIERVFMLQERKDETHRIREAWSFDWQSHGDAATLNREILTSRENGVFYEWSPAIAHFVRSAHMKGHRIVPVGHSAGAATMIMTTKEIPTNELSYVAMILVEPTLVTRELFNAHLEDRMASMDFAIAATSARRDRWPSKEHAFEYFKKRIPWGFWDPRVVRLLTEYGLEETSSGNVTLKCHKKQEANSYPDVEPHFEGAIQLGRICHSLPVHLIWGTRNDLVPEFIQDSLSDVSQGRMVASVTKVKRAGHMVVQEQPDLLAQAISDVLNTIDPGCCIGRSKL